MALRRIEKEWQGFARMAFDGQQVTAVQRDEMKKAFFAGAWSIFTALEEIGEQHVTEEEGESYLTDRKAECEAFKTRLLAEYNAPPRLMKDMTEPELREYFNQCMSNQQLITPVDVIGFMLIMFMDNEITQYASSIDPETAPEALRELATRIERRETVKR